MKRNVLTYLLLPFLLALLVTACKDDTLPASPAEEEEAGSGVYVSVVVNTGGSNASRVPTPGEGGDGPQAGTVEESTVHDLNVFFFQGDDGINSDANTEITHCLYFSQDNNNLFGGIGQGDYDAVYYSATEDVSDKLQIGETYNVLVIANAGDLRNNEELKTLSGLRDYQVSETITNDGYFLMSSESDASIEIKANTPATAKQVSVNIERMTARVDYKIAQSYITDSGDKVTIKNATLVNKHETSPYVFKRVSKNIENLSDIEYLGNEAVTGNIASNYVLDPYTASNDLTKRMYGMRFANFEDWNQSAVWKELQVSPDYTRLEYTEENIVTVDVVAAQRSTYCTGIVFKAQYIPKGFEDKQDKSFYWYSGKAYASWDEIGIAGLTESNYEDYGVIYYRGGICYYTYWIRHADDDNPDVISPMEYAIVRNNIYQLNVNSISGIGSETPQDEVKVSIKVYVKNWEEIETEDVVWGDPASES